MALWSSNITVDFTEINPSPQERIGKDGITVTRYLKCAWADRITLAKQLAGYEVDGILYIPDEYDPPGSDENLSFVYCQSVDIEPIGKYQFAKLTAHYSTVRYDVSFPGQNEITTYLAESIEPATEFMTLSNETLYWDNTQTTAVLESEKPSYLIGMCDWNLTYFNWQYPIGPLLDLIGKVNAAIIESPTYGYAFGAERLLMGDPTFRREFTTAGVTAWEITIRLHYHPKGWNNFPRGSDTGAPLLWGEMYSSDGTEKVFYTTDGFSALRGIVL